MSTKSTATMREHIAALAEEITKLELREKKKSREVFLTDIAAGLNELGDYKAFAEPFMDTMGVRIRGTDFMFGTSDSEVWCGNDVDGNFVETECASAELSPSKIAKAIHVAVCLELSRKYRKRDDFLDALRDFEHAAIQLVAAFYACDDNEWTAQKYPFAHSFDEETASIRVWREKLEAEHGN